VVVCLVFVVILFLVVFLVIRIVDLSHFEDGKGKGFAKQIAFVAHPQANDGVIVHFRHRKRMAAGFQDNDVAWFHIHNLYLREG
jgi:hypothetical protein